MSQQRLGIRFALSEWLLRGAVGFVYVSLGLEKLTAAPGSMWFTLFAHIGWGQWFRYFTGTVQVLGGILIVIPPTTAVGMVMLAATMAGQFFFHLFVLGDPLSSIIPALLLIAIVVIGRRKGSKADEMTSLEL
jgi:putative oxidoreductase